MEEAFLKQAIALAAEHARTGAGGPFGAVVVRHGAVVGRGWNRVVPDHDPTAHAEVMAIRAAAQTLGTHRLDDCEIYASCEPCPMCLAAIYWARIPRLYYAGTAADAAAAGFDDRVIARELTLPPDQRGLTIEQGCREDCREVFRDWLQNPDHRPY